MLFLRYTPCTTAKSSTVALAEDWRVRPLDDLQWILEHRRSGLKGGTARWDARAYCTTRAGLETAVSALKADGVVLDPAPLAQLPETFDGRPPTLSRRELLDRRIAKPSGEEIVTGVRKAVAAGIAHADIARLLQARRSETVRLLARIGLQDDGSVDDLGRLAKLVGGAS